MGGKGSGAWSDYIGEIVIELDKKEKLTKKEYDRQYRIRNREIINQRARWRYRGIFRKTKTIGSIRRKQMRLYYLNHREEINHKRRKNKEFKHTEKFLEKQARQADLNRKKCESYIANANENITHKHYATRVAFFQELGFVGSPANFIPPKGYYRKPYSRTGRIEVRRSRLRAKDFIDGKYY